MKPLPLFTESDHCRLRRDGVNGASCASCRSSLHFRSSLLNAYSLPHDDDVNFECPHGVPWPEGHEPKPIGNSLLSRLVGAGASIVRTQVLRIDRVDDDTFRGRLAVCAACPDVTIEHGRPQRCGPMYAAWRWEGGSTCGCLLKLKARDRHQACPQGKWPAPPQDERANTTIAG